MISKVGQGPSTSDGEGLTSLERLEAGEIPSKSPRWIHEAFETRSREKPDAVAVEVNGRSLTYSELEARSRELAGRLRRQGAGPEMIVGLLTDRSESLVVGMLAILRSGAAYLPLDPTYPEERLRLMLEDSDAAGLVLGESLSEEFPWVAAEGRWVERVNRESADLAGSSPSLEPGGPSPTPETLAWVIYTSGSTGKPKGVAIQHRGASALLDWSESFFHPEDFQRVLAATSVCFDISVFEILITLTQGGTVVLVPNALALPDAPSVSLVNTVPSAMAELVREGALAPSIRTVNLAGEALPEPLARAVHGASPSLRLINLYGPSEDTTYSTYAVIPRQGDQAPPIGLPISGTQVHVTSASGELLPRGVPGDLRLGGQGLARGYLRRPGLTADRFTPNPFGPPGSRLYRTGDLVRVGTDGQLEYLGRLDHQVKLRGFRIELGEVAVALESLPGVRQAAAAVHGSGPDARLVGYVVSEPPQPTEKDLARDLAASVPAHMVPTFLVFLAELPRTPNGKLDRKALPAPQAASAPPTGEKRTHLEEQLTTIWTEVLGLERSVRVEDSFFDLGGHSLLAGRVLSQVEASVGVELHRSALFEAPTIRSLANLIREHQGMGAVGRQGLRREADGGRLRPSPQQLQLWLFEQGNPGAATYNVLEGFELRGPLVIRRLERALKALLERHETLRSRIVEDDEGPLVVVDSAPAFQLPVVDLQDLSLEAAKATLMSLEQREGRHALVLEESPVLRGLLVRRGGELHDLLLTVHHGAADGWSMDLLRRELGEIYSLEEPAAALLVETPLRYSDFTRWQERWLSTGGEDDLVAFWRDQLAGLEPLELPTDRPRPPRPSHRGDRISILDLVAREDLDRLRGLARDQQGTLFMVLLAAFQWLLSRWTGQTDLAVGVPAAQRDRQGLEPIVGYLINILVLRSHLRRKNSSWELLAQVRETVAKAFRHQDLPFERMSRAMAEEGSGDRNPLFQALFQLTAKGSSLNLQHLEIEARERHNGTAKFDLELSLTDDGERVDGYLELAADLFDETTMLRLLGHYRRLLQEMARNPQVPLGQLNGLSAAERHGLLCELNGTASSPEPAQLVHQLFEATAQSSPSSVAVVAEGESLTYAELDEQANGLAHVLRQQGVTTDTPVALLLGRTPALAVAVLAVLKAGGGYLPLDPSYPAERLLAMVEDGRPALILASRGLRETLPALANPGPDSVACPVIIYEEVAPAAAAPSSLLSSPLRGVDSGTPSSLAYLLFTSGSTARPKGVAMAHGALVNLVRWQTNVSTPEPRLKTVQFAALSFDVSFQEMFSTWASGGTLYLISETVRQDPSALLELIEEQGIERLFLPYVALQALAEAGVESPWPATLREVITAGEQPRLGGAVGRWLARAAQLRFHNQYGPTESHVTSAWTWLGPIEEAPERPPIGRPISNHRLLILDPSGLPAGIGLPGELLIGGAGLARGYVGRARWTAERFVPDSFSSQPGGRLYRTGDRARVLPNGDIEYLGRGDGQVKIRGYRVELGELETLLEEHPTVGAAVAVLHDSHGSGGRLVAHVVPQKGMPLEAVDPEILRDFLSQRLPAFMVPTAIGPLATLPRTPSGKLDRRSLPKLETASRQRSAAEPQSPVGVLMLQLWTELFRQDAGQALHERAALEIDPRDDFFALGGHSLLAARLAARVRVRFGVACSVRQVFEHPTATALAAVVEGQLAGDERATSEEPIPNLPADVITAPASLSQERFLVLYQLDPTSAAYVLWDAWTLEGELSLDALDQALQDLLRLHGSLRTRFDLTQDPPRQYVEDQACAQIRGMAAKVLDVSSLPSEEGMRRGRLFFYQAVTTPFSAESSSPKLRTWVCQRSRTSWNLLLTFPHFAVDGGSMPILRKDLEDLYRRRLNGEEPKRSNQRPTYLDFAFWQRQYLADSRARDLEYWKERLQGEPAVLRLPTDRSRSSKGEDIGGTLHRPLAPAARIGVVELAQRHGATPFMVVLTAFRELLRRLTGQKDVVVGVPIAGRNRPEQETLVGCFVNVLPMRLISRSGETVGDSIHRIRGTVLKDLAHGEIAFDELAAAISGLAGEGRTTLYDTLFQVLDLGSERLSLGEAEGRPLAVDNGLSRVELEWTVRSGEGDLGLWLEYNSSHFDRTTVLRWTEAFQHLLVAMADGSESLLEILPSLPSGERQQLLHEWNDTAADLGPDLCLHQLFESQARRVPEAIAVLSEGESLTYSELEAAANRLARRLQQVGVATEQRVGVVLERSLELSIALMAILKVGGAYVPLDPQLPTQRLGFMIADAGLDAVVTGGLWVDSLELARGKAQRCTILNLDKERDRLADLSPAPLATAVDPSNAAYAIYTSGSTGQPKAVLNSHRGIVNRLRWGQRTLPLGTEDRVLQKTPFSFDVSVWELFWPLVTGARLVYAAPGGHQDPAYILRLICKEGVTVAHFVPSMLRVFLQEPLEEAETLRRVVVSGEALPADLERSFLARSNAELYNLYGPTEAAVEVTYWHCRREQPRNPVPIGRPIANLGLRVVDRQSRGVGTGVEGELLLAGVGLARGYLGRPALTAASFIPDAASAAPGERAYRTGDLVRWAVDGTVEFLGRIDHQVKIRGFRIELGEIESAVADFPWVRESAVVAWEAIPGDARLVAYLVVDSNLDIPSLRETLSQRLPAHMVPDHFVTLDRLPLSVNGKLDRRALPLPTVEDAASVAGGELPRTMVEEILADLWVDLLGVGRVYRSSDFFQLGGHSLSAVRLAGQVRSVLGVELPLAVVFDHSSLSELASAVEELRRGSQDGVTLAPPVAMDREAESPASYAQERMLFLQQSTGREWAYHVPWGVTLAGPLFVQGLGEALNSLRQRHEVLRTALSISEGRGIQETLPYGPRPLPVVDLQGLPPTTRQSIAGALGQRETRLPFSLAQGEPMRALLLRLDEGEHILALTLHHSAADAWSLELLQDELWSLYRGPEEQIGPALEDLPLQYADYTLWQRRAFDEGGMAADLDFWRSALENPPEVLGLPTDRPRVPGNAMRGESLAWRLDEAASDRLRDLGRERGATLFMVLLAALQALLSKVSGQGDVIAGAPVAGRGHRELDGLVGLFVNAVALRTQLRGGESFRQLLERVRETSLNAFQHEEIPFDKLVEILAPRRAQGVHPIFQVFFQLQVPGTPVEVPKSLAVEAWHRPADTGKFDLELCVQDSGASLAGSFEYDGNLFDATTARRLLDQYLSLLHQVTVEEELSWEALSLLTPATRHQVIHEWNDTEAGLGEDLCLHQLIEAQAQLTPNAEAVSFEGEALSYQELDHAANGLAHELRDLGVGPEVFVGVALERGPHMILSLMAILKAGGAYVPLDPSLPEDRLSYMVADAQVAVLLTHQRWRSLFDVGDGAATPTTILELDGDRDGDGFRTAMEPPPALLHPLSPAYAIYTSGSTGLPKGVVNSHRGIVNRLRWMQAAYALNAEDRILQKTPFSFDVSVWEFFWPLMTGASLVFARPEGHKDPAYLLEVMGQETITTVHFVPSMLQLFMAVEIEAAISLRRVITSGEALPADLERRFVERSTAELHNLYGPTEAAVDVTAWPCRRERPREPLPIGRPISNMAIRVVDRRSRPLPAGIPGELLLVGPGLARGYRGRPALTAASFVPDPEAREPGERAYRTGDLVRFCPDGVLEFLGRIDHQVKIRGFRIELGEIESELAHHPLVGEVVVQDRKMETGDRQLVAYLVAGADVAVETLKSFLGKKLPDYMVPARFVFLDELPLSPNGKVDRKALPVPEAGRSHLRRTYVPPRTPTEIGLAEIWGELMKIDEVGVEDDFFDLGGHSLLAIHVVTHIRERWQVDLPVAVLFGAPTVEKLAATVDAAAAGGEASNLVPMGGLELDSPPFFCVHGIGGNVFRLVQLARRIASHRGFIGIQGWADLADTEYLSSVETMAQRYVDEVEKHQPEGPLFLGGYSLGSMVAYEMARICAERGRVVAFVALLDVPAPAAEASSHVAAQYLSKVSYEGGMARELGIPISLDKLKELTPKERLIYVLQEGRRHGALPPGFGPQDALRFIDVYRKTAAANHSYGPQPYSGDVTLFSTQRDDEEEDPTRGWGELVAGVTEVIQIPGDHTSMVRPPHVGALADALVEAMERAMDRLSAAVLETV